MTALLSRYRVLSRDPDVRLIQALNILVSLYEAGSVEQWITERKFNPRDGQSRIHSATKEIGQQLKVSAFETIVGMEREPMRFKRALNSLTDHELASKLLAQLPKPSLDSGAMRTMGIYFQETMPLHEFERKHGRGSHASLCSLALRLSEYNEELWDLVMQRGARDLLNERHPLLESVYYSI